MADADQLTWAHGTVLYDSPDKALIRKHARAGKLMSAAVEREIEMATQELIIVSPYFVPSEHELVLLQNAALRKSRVRILTNSMESTPEVAAHSGYQKVRIPLIKSGAELFEVRAKLDSTRGSGQGPSISKYGNYALHGKMYVLDRAKVFLGSWNYDQRSLRINTEIGLLIESGAVAGGVAQRFDSMVSPEAAYRVQLETDSHQRDVLVWTARIQDRMVRLTVEPSRGLFRRVKARLLSLLRLEPEL